MKGKDPKLSLKISSERRRLFFMLMNGIPDISKLCFYLHYRPDCELILKALIKNNITGKKLIQTIEYDFNGHFEKLVRHLVGRRYML